MEWLLVGTVILMLPVIDGGPEKPGDILKSVPIGIAATEVDCETAGRAMVDVFNRKGRGSTLSIFNCVELTSDQVRIIGEAQGFKPE